MARRSRRRALELPIGARVREWFAASPSVVGRTPIVLGAPLAFGVGLLFVPKPFAFGALNRAASGRAFLSTLWQVEAGAIALSLTLILVAFETIWRARFRGSVRRFADEVLLLYAVAFAFASLFVIGCTLVGWGTGAPGGWAATWSTILSALAFGFVPIVLVRTLVLMNPAYAHERRLDQIRAEVHDAVDNEAFERLAYTEQKAFSERSPSLDFTPMLAWGRAFGVGPIKTRRAGVVRDVRMGRLAAIAKRLGTDDTVALLVGGYIGLYVPRAGDLAFIGKGASRWQRWRARRAFAIDTHRTRSRLYDVIAHIHEEALQAIREVQPSTYSDLAELWVDLLVAFPEAWARYGQPFSQAIAGEFGRFGLGPVDTVARNLFIEAREGTKSMHDIAVEAFGVPDAVVMHLVDLDAPALVLPMLALYVDLYPITADLDDDRLRERLLTRLFELPAQYGRYLGYRFRDYDLPEADRHRIDTNLRIVFRTFMEQMKAVVDHDPSRTDRVGRINSLWIDIFAGWFPEHDQEDIWPGLNPEEEQRRLDRNAQIDAVIRQRDELDELRNAYLFAVAYWTLSRLRDTRNPDWLEILNAIVPWLGPPERLAREAERVAEIDLEDRTFLGWHDGIVQMGWAAPRAFITLTLFRFPPNEIPADVGKRNFLTGGMLVEIERTVDEVAADAALWNLLGGSPTDLPARVGALHAALQSSFALP